MTMAWRCVWGEVQLAVVGRADAANGRQTWRHMTEGLSVDCAPDASPSRASHGVANRWSSFHIEKVLGPSGWVVSHIHRHHKLVALFKLLILLESYSLQIYGAFASLREV
uniref:Uncharacterized protein n=1 Tax=Physcomitrium patens TaxID=3218 RepID=A0A7I4B6Q7_PHYPA